MDFVTKTSPRRWPICLGVTAALFAAALGIVGCNYANKPALPLTRGVTIPPDPHLPAYLKNSIKDLTVVNNIGDFPVSSWGLVVDLRGTGDSTCPSPVREWMLKEMRVHRFGMRSAGYGDVSPEAMLDDPHVALVGVLANIPPGARKGDYVDVVVQAMPGNNTSSLANGMLYRTDLGINGLSEPAGAVATYVKAQGNIFVNPVYAANTTAGAGGGATLSPSRNSLRGGHVPGGGLVMSDRPIHLVLRNPSWATSRIIENRINERFKMNDRWRDAAALAQDERYLHLMVPASYRGDWRHFVGVVTHLYMSSDPAFSAQKAKLLAVEAVKPGASLMDISYCWEGLGQAAIPYITPLLSYPQQDVQYAAARAAAFIGDAYGADRLVEIAATPGHAFQINAVQTLGQLPDSEQVDAHLGQLLDTNQSLVRLAAYDVLVNHDSPRIVSTPIRSKLNPENEFILDIVDCDGPPLIYCTRLGKPRVAIFGRHVSMLTPLAFSAFDSRLTITNHPTNVKILDIFYRDDGRRTAVQASSSTDVAGLVARLGGASDEGFHFTYGDVVAILQTMANQKAVAASFVLQDLPEMAKQVQDAPALPETRPQAELSATNTGAQIGASLPDLRPPPATQPALNSTQRPQ